MITMHKTLILYFIFQYSGKIFIHNAGKINFYIFRPHLSAKNEKKAHPADEQHPNC